MNDKSLQDIQTLKRPTEPKDAGSENFKKLEKKMPPHLVQKVLEFEHNENWDDNELKYPEFDIITRRFLEFCSLSG